MIPNNAAGTPLAERMRPRSFDEFAGQRHLVGEGAPLRKILEKGSVPSCILYGPPGTGKTTLARLMARMTGRDILEINAVSAKVAELRDLVRHRPRRQPRRQPLFAADAAGGHADDANQGDGLAFGIGCQHPARTTLGHTNGYRRTTVFERWQYIYQHKRLGE